MKTSTGYKVHAEREIEFIAEELVSSRSKTLQSLVWLLYTRFTCYYTESM